jgi:hypothetical protein
VSRTLPGLAVPSVVTNEPEAMGDATRALLDAGRRRIVAVLGPDAASTTKRRESGHRQTMVAAGCEPLVRYTDQTGPDARAAIAEALRAHPRRHGRDRIQYKGHPVYDEFVGQDQPERARVRNPVTYLDAPVGGWPCGCGCGTEIYAGEFVHGHEQTALHQRVAEIGTISEFLRWFDAVRAGDSSARPYVGTSVTLDGRLQLSVDANGTIAGRRGIPALLVGLQPFIVGLVQPTEPPPPRLAATPPA